MNKNDLANKIVEILMGSTLFTPGGIAIFEASKLLFDEKLSIEETFEKLQHKIKFATYRGNNIDISKEKSILNEYFSIIKDNMDNFNKKDWLSEKEQEEALSYCLIKPFDDINIQLAIINLIFITHNIYSTYCELSNMDLIAIPEELNENLHDDMLKINSAEYLDNAYYFKDINKIVYPAFDYKMKCILNNVNLSECDLYIRPKKIVAFEQYSPNYLLTEERIFGIPFNKENLKKVLSKESGEFKYNFYEEKDLLYEKAFFIPLDRLEYYIEPNDGNLVSLSLEDVIDYSKTDNLNLKDRYFITPDGKQKFIKHRYLHVIFDRTNLNVVHCDMSWLIYFDDKIELRNKSKLKDRKVRADKKIKIFRIDAHKGKYLPFDLFQTIGGNAMDAKRNPEVVRFFSGE